MMRYKIYEKSMEIAREVDLMLTPMEDRLILIHLKKKRIG
jgi:hypothetical protein